MGVQFGRDTAGCSLRDFEKDIYSETTCRYEAWDRIEVDRIDGGTP